MSDSAHAPYRATQDGSHDHWLEKGFFEIWLLLRRLDRALRENAGQAADLQRLIGAHFEECALAEPGVTERLLADMITISIRDCLTPTTSSHPLKTFLLRERRRLMRDDKHGKNLNVI